MAVDWTVDGNKKWKEYAIKEQQSYFVRISGCEWKEFDPKTYLYLKRDIGYALFGDPDQEPHANLNDNTGYNKEKLKEINELFRIIRNCTKNNKNPNNICVSFLCVLGKTKDARITVPVIKTEQFDKGMEQNNYIFIDSCGRVYKNWQHYLDTNTMPECVLCYPRNGVYSAVKDVVDVEFGVSPAGRTGAKILNAADIGGSVLSVGAAGALIVGMFVPVALPVVAAAVGSSMFTGAYSAVRNIQTLVDRDEHQQSIGLDSAESRSCWLGIAGGATSILLGPKTYANFKIANANVKIAQAGVECTQANVGTSRTAQIFKQPIAFGSCVLNGLVVANGIAIIVDKYRNEEKITTLDIFQFTSALLFFTHSVVSVHQAISLINRMGNSSSGELFDHIQAWKNLISGAYNIVPAVPAPCSYIVSTFVKGNFWFLCYKVHKELKECVLRGMRYCMLKVRELLRQVWEWLSKEMAEIVYEICQAFGVKHWSELVINGSSCIESSHIRAIASILIAGKKSLVGYGSTAMPSDQMQASSDNSAGVGTNDWPNSVVDGETQTYDTYYHDIGNILVKFVDRNMWRSPEDLCKYLVFICKFVKSQFLKKKSDYEKSWQTVKLFQPNVKIEDFEKQTGISGNPNDHFLQEVFNEFKKEKDAFTLLQLAYVGRNDSTSAQEEEYEQGFLDADGVRFYPFYSERGLARNGMLSVQQYREKAAKFTGQNCDTSSIYISASGDTAVIEMNGAADVITLQCWVEDGKVSGIVAVLHTASE